MKNNPNYIGFVTNKEDIYLIKNGFIGAIIEVTSESKYYKITNIDWRTKKVLAFEDINSSQDISPESFKNALTANKETVKEIIYDINNEYRSDLDNLDEFGKLKPGKYKLGEVTEIKLIDDEDNSLIPDTQNEIIIYFKTPANDSISIEYKTPDLHWIDDDYPVNLDKDTNYVISIMNKIGVYGKYLN